MSASIGEKTRSGMYWSLSLKVPYEIVRFGMSIITARILDPKDFGIISIASMIIFYANTLTNFGFNHALVQRKEITDQHVYSVFTLDLLISCCMASIFYLAAPGMASFFHSPESKDVIRVMSLVFIIMTFYDLPYALLRRELNFRLVTVADIMKELSASVITLLFAVWGMQYWSLVWGQIIALTTVTIYLIIKARWKPAFSLNKNAIRDLFNFGAWSFIRLQLYFFSSRLDRLIVARYLSPSILGVYDKSKSLSQMPTESIATNINTVLFSSFSRVQENKAEILSLLRKSLVVTSVLIFPIYVGLYAIAEFFVPIVLGSKWNAMIVPLQIMCISGIIASLNGLISTVAVGIGEYQRYTVQQIATTGILFILCLVAVRWGIEAVAIGVVLYSLVTSYLSLDILKKKMDLTWSELFRCLFPPLICSAIMFASVKGTAALFTVGHGLIALGTMIAVGAATYALTILVFPSSALDSIRVSVNRDLRTAWMRIMDMRRS